MTKDYSENRVMLSEVEAVGSAYTRASTSLSVTQSYSHFNSKHSKPKFHLNFFTKIFLLLTIVNCQSSIVNAQSDSLDYYKPDYIRFDDFVYRNNIKTVLLEGANAELSDAAIELNSTQQLKLSFDELDADIKDYSYTLMHCTHDWQPSPVADNRYLQGFSTNKIFDYKASSTALMPYVHYNLIFPDDVVKPSISGNYIIKVFDSSYPDSIILTKRFIVFERRVSVESNIHQATFADKHFSHQEIDFTINTNGANIVNAYQDLHVVIQQNRRWDNAITNLKPLLVNGNVLDYDYNDENCFDGGNEFRTFDIRSIRYHSERIQSVVLNPATQQYEVFLLPDERISSQRYSTQNDINGKYLIKYTEGHNSETDGDYVKVHFHLKIRYPEEGGTMHVFGALTNWKADASSRMNYNDSTHEYELTLLLKQGYYNYQYAFVADGKTVADASVIEGSHNETENDYTILAYLYSISKGCDELIEIQKTNSSRK
ncbi:MAG: DUF5103 domain-containing protein [Bacteroidia bacterium]